LEREEVSKPVKGVWKHWNVCIELNSFLLSDPCPLFKLLDVIEDLVVITPRNVKGGRKLSKIIRCEGPFFFSVMLALPKSISLLS
jgi:hypothetical protein